MLLLNAHVNKGMLPSLPSRAEDVEGMDEEIYFVKLFSYVITDHNREESLKIT